MKLAERRRRRLHKNPAFSGPPPNLDENLERIGKALFGLLQALAKPQGKEKCSKCGMRVGQGFCDRALLGEPGACEFGTTRRC